MALLARKRKHPRPYKSKAAPVNTSAALFAQLMSIYIRFFRISFLGSFFAYVGQVYTEHEYRNTQARRMTATDFFIPEDFVFVYSTKVAALRLLMFLF
jgi:hypothetical protein